MDPGEVLTRSAAAPDAVLRYAPHEDGVVDLHLPPGPGPHPLVLLVHGGFWKQAYDRRHVRPLARALVDAGHVVAAPEYRRVGGLGGWPATLEDVEAAARLLPALLEGLGVATTRTTFAGHSAGGHLVLWLASRGLPVDRVLGLAPVADLRRAAREGLGDRATQGFLGGEPWQVPQRYDASDPCVLLPPLPHPPEVVLLHGRDDDVVPVSQSRALADAAPWVEVRELPDADHFDVIDPTSSAWPALVQALR